MNINVFNLHVYIYYIEIYRNELLDIQIVEKNKYHLNYCIGSSKIFQRKDSALLYICVPNNLI